jgi:phage repressor protein C with HTH and peptisase S24 domain
MSKFWDRVTTLMSESGYTMNSISIKIGKNERSIEGWKRQGLEPRASDVVKMARLLGVTVEELVTGKKPSVLSKGGDEEIVYEIHGSEVIAVSYAQVKENDGLYEICPQDGYGSRISIPPAIARGLELKRLLAVEILGDEMIDAGMNSGDIVVFQTGLIGGNGKYAVRMEDKLYIRRVEFLPIGRKIVISPENKQYTCITVDALDEAVEVLGKVVCLIHRC